MYIFRKSFRDGRFRKDWLTGVGIYIRMTISGIWQLQTKCQVLYYTHHHSFIAARQRVEGGQPTESPMTHPGQVRKVRREESCH